MLTSILWFISVAMITIAVLTVFLPNFKKQKQLASIASWLNKSDVEIQALNQGQMIRLISERILPAIDQKWSVQYLFGKKFYEKYQSLGRPEPYMVFLANIILKSFIMVPPVLLLGFVTHNTLAYILIPVSIIVLFYTYLRGINKLYKNRQNQLINDLPNLISKMILALETGKSFVEIFTQVADQSSELLADMLKRLIANMQIMDRKEALQIFANEVNIPVIYDFISVVNVGMDKGYKEAIPDFNSIKNNLRSLRKLSLIEQTKGNPEKMNLFYVLLCAHVVIFLFIASIKMFSMLNSI
ncbi:hypothetical protein D3C74_91000 [compost metagenome]